MYEIIIDKMMSYNFPYFFKKKIVNISVENTYYFLIRNSDDIFNLAIQIKAGHNFEHLKTDYINWTGKYVLCFDQIDGDFDRIDENVFYFKNEFCITEVHHKKSYKIATKIDRQGTKIDCLYFDKKIDNQYYFQNKSRFYYNKDFSQLPSDYFVDHFLNKKLNLIRIELEGSYYYGVADISGNILVKPMFNAYQKNTDFIHLYSYPCFFFNGNKYVLYNAEIHVDYGLKPKPLCCFKFDFDDYNLRILEKRKYNGNEMIYLTDDLGKWFNLYFSLFYFFIENGKLKILEFENIEILKRILDNKGLLEINFESLRKIIATLRN